MSKIGKRPIIIPEGVTVEITDQKVSASFEGKNNHLLLPKSISITKIDNKLKVSAGELSKENKPFLGLYARLISNLLVGTKENFTRELIFTGTGYRASIENETLVLFMGYSHDIKLPIPSDLTCTVKKNSIVISGAEKRAVGSFASIIRDVRPPEVYKGKGIRYKDEIIKRKAGKRAATT